MPEQLKAVPALFTFNGCSRAIIRYPTKNTNKIAVSMALLKFIQIEH